jgi:hypothetical protein
MMTEVVLQGGFVPDQGVHPVEFVGVSEDGEVVVSKDGIKIALMMMGSDIGQRMMKLRHENLLLQEELRMAKVRHDEMIATIGESVQQPKLLRN